MEDKNLGVAPAQSCPSLIPGDTKDRLYRLHMSICPYYCVLAIGRQVLKG